MTAGQITLEGDTRTFGANGKQLTPDQEVAYRLVRDTPGGVTAEQVGAQLHERLTTRWQHPAGQPCMYCDGRGKQVLASKAVGPLVIRRKTGRYELRDGSTPPEARETAQLDGLPGDSWEDMFGDAA